MTAPDGRAWRRLDRLSCRNSAVVSSDRRVLGQAFLIDLPGLPRRIAPAGLSARPLTKYAMTALNSVTSAVMHQPMRSKRTFSALACRRKAAEERLHILLGYLNGHLLLVSRFVLHHKAVQRIHAVRAGVKQQQIQAHARRRDEQRSQYRDAPLDRNSFRSFVSLLIS